MQKRTREILALLLLLLLGLLAVAAMGWYILVGHNWNVAATNIDDSVGQMEGYTVFLVEGTRPESAAHEADGAKTDEMSKAMSASDADDITMDTKPEQDNTHIPDTISESKASAENSTTKLSASNETALEDARQDDYFVALSKLASEYQAKGAAVAIVRNWQRGAYDEPRTVHMTGRVISLFEVNYPVRPAAVRTQLKLLERRDSNFNIMLTNDLSLDERAFKGVEIVIFTNPDKEYEHGHYHNGSYCVDVAPVGHTEAIIVAPSGVISSKTLTLPDVAMPLGPYEVSGPFMHTEPEKSPVSAELAESAEHAEPAEYAESAESAASAGLTPAAEETRL